MDIKLIMALMQLLISLAFLGVAIYLAVESRKTLKLLRERANQPRPLTTPQEIIDYLNKSALDITAPGE